jgi:hypothetical protein
MKPHLLKISTLLLVVAVGLASSCHKPIEYPIDISFTEYSLEETSCQWQNLPYDEKVIVINSDEELKKYISCTEDSYPVVDFSKYTLLLASGSTANNILKISNELQQLSSNQYGLTAKITPSTTYIYREWSKTLIVKKMDKSCVVTLKILFNAPEENSSLYYVIGYNNSCFSFTPPPRIFKPSIYLLISEDGQDLVAARGLPDDLFKFPESILHYEYCCWEKFFPDEYRFAYPVLMSYTASDEPTTCACIHEQACSNLYIRPQSVEITSISKYE